MHEKYCCKRLEKILKQAQKTNIKQVWAKLLAVLPISAEQYRITATLTRQAFSTETSNPDLYIRYYLGTVCQVAKHCQIDKKPYFKKSQFCFQRRAGIKGRVHLILRNTKFKPG